MKDKILYRIAVWFPWACLGGIAFSVIMLIAAKRNVGAHLEIIPAVYSLEYNGFDKGIPCNPPVPANSNLMCTEKSRSWALKCNDSRTIDILPRIDNPFFYDFGKAKERGDKFWCVLAVEE